MPFITEEIWQNLAKICPERGFADVSAAEGCLITAAWPELDAEWRDADIENQFALYQTTLGCLREVRGRQQIANKAKVNFMIECDSAVSNALQPLSGYFSRMANATLVGMGATIEPPETNALIAAKNMKIYVDLDGLIDEDAEIKRLEKEKENLAKSIQSKERQLGNEKFVAAKPDLAEEIRAGLVQAQEQLATVDVALAKLIAKRDA